MNIFLIVLAVIAAIIILLLTVALFSKKEYAIECEITINKPKQAVFDFIKYIKNQEHYNKWVMMDPNSKKEYKGTDGTVGFVSAWDSAVKDVGKGEQEIVKINEGERLELKLHFIKPFEGIAMSYMATETVSENQTKVKWGFSSSMKYPMNIMLVLMNLEKMLANDLTTGLTTLKKVLEK